MRKGGNYVDAIEANVRVDVEREKRRNENSTQKSRPLRSRPVTHVGSDKIEADKTSTVESAWSGTAPKIHDRSSETAMFSTLPYTHTHTVGMMCCLAVCVSVVKNCSSCTPLSATENIDYNHSNWEEGVRVDVDFIYLFIYSNLAEPVGLILVLAFPLRLSLATIE